MDNYIQFNVEPKVNVVKESNGYYNQIGAIFKDAPSEKVPETVNVDISKSFNINVNALFEDIKNMQNMNDSQMRDLVLNSYMTILELVTRTNENPYFAYGIISVFSNERYVNTLINVLQSNKLDYDHKIYLNHIIYNYRSYKEYNKDSLISKLHMQLANVVNADILPKLYSSGLNRELLDYLAVCKYSTTDQKLSVMRVNLEIFKYSEKLELQNVVDIYQYLFADGVGNLFNSVMLDVYSVDELNNATPIQRDNYSLMGLAVLELVNNMPSLAIRTILRNFISISAGRTIRFPLNLSADYWRINNEIDVITSGSSMY